MSFVGQIERVRRFAGRCRNEPSWRCGAQSLSRAVPGMFEYVRRALVDNQEVDTALSRYCVGLEIGEGTPRWTLRVLDPGNTLFESMMTQEDFVQHKRFVSKPR